MSFGKVASGPNVVALGPGVSEKTLCDAPVQYAFYKDGTMSDGECFDPESAACPAGYELIGTTPQGCERTAAEKAQDLFTGRFFTEQRKVRAVCRKTSFAKDTPAGKLDCCLRQKASSSDGTECPPGYCREKINDRAADIAGVDEGCFDVFVKHCMGEYRRADGSIAYDGWRMFTDDDCKQYVQREDVRNGPNKRRIADFMTQLCKAGGRFAASQPLCRCVLSSEEKYCLQDDCFARQNRALANLAPCFESDACSGAEVYKPPEPEGGCPGSVCAPLLELKCVNLQSEQAIKVLVDCSLTGEMSDEQLRAAAERLGVSVADVKRAAERRAAGEAVAAGTPPKPDIPEPSASTETLSTGAYVAIAVALLFFVLLVAVLVSRNRQVRSAWQARPQWMMRQQQQTSVPWN